MAEEPFCVTELPTSKVVDLKDALKEENVSLDNQEASNLQAMILQQGPPPFKVSGADPHASMMDVYMEEVAAPPTTFGALQSVADDYAGVAQDAEDRSDDRAANDNDTSGTPLSQANDHDQVQTTGKVAEGPTRGAEGKMTPSISTVMESVSVSAQVEMGTGETTMKEPGTPVGETDILAGGEAKPEELSSADSAVEPILSAKTFTPSVTDIQAAVAQPVASSALGDTYAYEEEQERLALLKALHQPMRKWFMEDGAAMRERFGNFPLFWQDLASWPHMKEVKKLYLMATEKRESSQGPATEEEVRELDTGEAEVRNGRAPVGTEATVSVEGEADSKARGINVANGASAMQDSATTGSGKMQDDEEIAEDTDAADDAGESDGKKKRKNRWGDATRKTRFADKDDEEDAETANAANKRKSRWSSDTTTLPAGLPGAKGVIPGMPVNLSQEQIQETLVLQMRLQQLNEKLATVVQDALERSQDPDRSPSPPPRYDGNGVRTNTRDVRMREALNKERTKVIEEMMKLNPLFRPPADFVKTKPHRKLYIPTEEYPGYNFIGLIIGPRGNTQKRMERETDCKIAIRGKGSVKEGARRGPKAIDEDDDLHVYISGETEENVEKAAKEVGMLLRPLDDEQNEHKQKQLRELALINGTLREEDYCNICGEKGHRQFECPKRAQNRSAAVEVRCALCGDTSHPTRDCLLHKTQKTGQPGHEASLDKEYLSFMAELGDGDAGAGPGSSGGGGTQQSSSSGGGSVSSGQGVSGSGTSSSSSARPASITNHYVWEPPKVAATPASSPPPAAAPPSMAGGARSGVPPGAYQHHKPTHHANHSSGPVYAQNSPPPPGQQRSPFSRNSGNGSSTGSGGVGGGGSLLHPHPMNSPPPMNPPPPPTPPVPPSASGGLMLPPVPPPQPPLPPPSSPAPGGQSLGSAGHSLPSPAPASAGGKYSHVPPPLPPGGMYNQPPPSPMHGAYGYPPPPPVPPTAWGGPPPPLPPSPSAYAPPPLPPSSPGVAPHWPSYHQGYAQPPLPATDNSGDQGQIGQAADATSHYAGGNPPLPPPPLPGQPPLPPG